MNVMRFLVRLGILGLAGYGAKTLYDKYSPRVNDLRGPANEFVERTTGAVQDAAERARRAARETAGAASDAAAEVERAADDAKDAAARRLQGSGDMPVPPKPSEAPTLPTATIIQ
jgi:hypothetical protein